MAKIIQAVLDILFFLYLLDITYGSHQAVSIAGLFGFAILSYTASHQGKQTEMIIFSGREHITTF